MRTGDEVILLRALPSRLGYLVAGASVTVLRDDTRTDGTLLVCVDRGYHPSGLCHVERVPVEDVAEAWTGTR